jgi:hypothetical protein
LRVTEQLGLDYWLLRDAVGMTAEVTWLRASNTADDLRSDRYLASINARWRRQLSQTWNLTISGGASVLAARDARPRPVASGDLAKNFEQMRAQLGVRHSQITSLENGAVLSVDDVTLIWALPLGWKRTVQLSCVANWSSNRSVNQSSAPRVEAQAWRTEGQLSWTPTREAWSVSLSYQYFRQHGSAEDTAILGNISRQVISLSAAAYFPEVRNDSLRPSSVGYSRTLGE